MTVTMMEAERIAGGFGLGDTSWLDEKGYSNVSGVCIDDGYLFIDCEEGVFGHRIEDSGITWRVTI